MIALVCMCVRCTTQRETICTKQKAGQQQNKRDYWNTEVNLRCGISKAKDAGTTYVSPELL